MSFTNLAMEKDTTSKLCAEHLSIPTFIDYIQSNDIYKDKEIWTHNKPSVRMYGDISNNPPSLSTGQTTDYAFHRRPNEKVVCGQEAEQGGRQTSLSLQLGESGKRFKHAN